MSHLDLELVGVGEVGGSNTKATGSDLLDGRTHGVAVLHEVATLSILTTLTSVGLATESVHGHGNGRVGLHRDGTVRHSASNETAHSLSPRLNLVDRDGVGGFKVKVEQTTKSAVLDRLVSRPGVCLVRLVVLGSDSVLDVGNRGGVVDVRLTAITPVVLSSLGETRNLLDATARVALLVESEGILGNLLKGHTTNTGGSTCEAAVDNGVVNTKSLKDLGTLVTLKSGDTHLTHDLQDSAINGVPVVVDELLLGDLLSDQTLTVELQDTLEGEVRVDSISTVANKDTHVVNLTSFGGLDHKSGEGPPLVANHVVVNHAGTQEGRDSNAVGTGLAVGQDENLVALLDGFGGRIADTVECFDVSGNTIDLGEGDVNRGGGPVRVNLVDLGQGVEFLGGEDWRREVEPVALFLVHLEQVALGTDVGTKRHDDGLTNGVDRRVGDLREELTEVLREQTRLLGQASQRCIVTHGTECLF